MEVVIDDNADAPIAPLKSVNRWAFLMKPQRPPSKEIKKIEPEESEKKIDGRGRPKKAVAADVELPVDFVDAVIDLTKPMVKTVGEERTNYNRGQAKVNMDDALAHVKKMGDKSTAINLKELF